MTLTNIDAQIRYLVQWFNEWSDLQRSDFLPVMAEKYSNKVYVNGIIDHMANVDCQDKPMSLFQCRIKLFKEWIAQWNQDQKENFLKQVSEIDANFAEKLTSELQNGTAHMNGHNGHPEEDPEHILGD